jgi:hypothetical protein
VRLLVLDRGSSTALLLPLAFETAARGLLTPFDVRLFGQLLPRRSPGARGDIEPVFGPLTGTVCGFTSAGGRPTLRLGTIPVSLRQSQGVFFRELRVCAQRLGSTAQG